MKTITARHGVLIWVSDEDYETLNAFRWGVINTGYACRWYRRPDGRTGAALMHREILGLTFNDGLIGDHINGDMLDNRRENLRVVSPGESSANVRARAASGYRGVYAARDKFVARVQVAGKVHALGRFNTAEEAAAVASAWRAQNMPGYVARPGSDVVEVP